MEEDTTTDGGADGDGSHDEEPASSDSAPSGSEGGPEELLDDISDSLSEEGYGVFHGQEFVSLRTKGQLAPNSTVSQQYLEGKEAVILAYNENANEIAIIPLEEDYDKTNVYSLQWTNNRVTIAVSGFLKHNNIQPDQTIRYPPEWDENMGGDKVPGALVIDLDQDGKVAPAAHNESDEEADEAEA